MNKINDISGELTQSKEKEGLRIIHRLLGGPGPAFLEPLFRIGEHHERYVQPYIQKGQVMLDAGCGWGHYSFLLADMVGPEGKVYSVDIAKKCIDAIQKKVQKRGYHNIEAHASSAADLSFIKDSTVDLVFSNGLLCSMPRDRSLFVNEVKRILKPGGYAYLYVGTITPMGYVDQPEWEEILSGFKFLEGDIVKERWALVSPKQ